MVSFVLMACLVLFGFTTILGWDYYGERCLEYFSNGSMKAVKTYRWLYIAAVFIGPYMTVAAVWTIADIFNGLMALPNMIALIALSGVVVKETKDYFARLAAAGNEDEMAPHLPATTGTSRPSTRWTTAWRGQLTYSARQARNSRERLLGKPSPRSVLACATGSAPILLAAPRPPKRTKKTGDPCAQASPHR